jgi:tetratricopeptide (TPR) repeat protein
MVVLVAAVAAYAPAALGTFHFDDYSLFSDPAVTSPDGWSQVWRLTQTRPLAWLTFWFNYTTGGQSPSAFLMLNVALHALCSLAVLRLAGRLVAPGAALAAAVLFAVHPAASEAVCYVFARPILLATLFCVLSATAFWDRRYALAVALFALALLSKEEAAAFPLALALLWWAKRERQGLIAIAGMLALSVAAGLRVIWAVKQIGAPAGAASGISPWQYLAAQGWAIAGYLWRVVIPAHFPIDPDLRAAPVEAWLIVIALAAAAWVFRARGGWFVLAGLILLIPSSSVFAVQDLAAYRRMYLPLAVWCVPLGLLVSRAKWPGIAVAGVVFAALSWQAASVWRTEESLWRQATVDSPNKVRPWIQLSRVVPMEQATVALQHAALNATGDRVRSAEVAAEQGRLALQAKQPVEAFEAFGRALAEMPNEARYIQNRAGVLYMVGQRDTAIAEFQRALKINPCLFEARYNLLLAGVSTALPEQCAFTRQQRTQYEEARSAMPVPIPQAR